MVLILESMVSRIDLRRYKRGELAMDITDTSLLSADYTGTTPLIEAVKNSHVEIIKLLLDQGPCCSESYRVLCCSNCDIARR